MKELSIIIPCHNEERNIPLIIKRFEDIKPKSLSLELRFVDNGSSDNTNKVIKKYMKKYDYISITEVKINQGYGFGIWCGLNEAKGKFLCWTHGDMQTDVNDTIKAYNLIKKEKNFKNCFVKGKRIKRTLIENFFSFGLSSFVSFIFLSKFIDIYAQPNLFHRSVLKKIRIPPKDGSFDLYFYFILKKMNYKFIRFSVLFPKRLHGESKLNSNLIIKFKLIKRLIGYTINLKKGI